MSKGTPFITIGYLFVTLGLFVALRVYFPIIKNEVVYQSIQKRIIIPQDLVPESKEFGIVIPKIQANSKVIRNVDPYDSSIYQKALTLGVAHAKGSSLPGQPGNIFIFSHSSVDFLTASRFNSVFYLLSKLTVGDKINIYFDNKVYDYTVSAKKVVDPSDTSYLSKKSDQEILTLMTCWPPGTSQKRLIVQAVRGR